MPNSSDRNAACGPYMAPWNTSPTTTASTVSPKLLGVDQGEERERPHPDADRAEQVHRLAAEPVGQRAPDRDRHEVHRGPDQHRAEHERAGQRRAAVGQRRWMMTIVKM